MMDKSLWDAQSEEWHKGWIAGQSRLITKEEIEEHTNEWKDGALYAATHPENGYVPM